MGEFFARLTIESDRLEFNSGAAIFLKISTLFLKTNVSIPIKIPTAINKIANIALYSDAFSFSEIFSPTCKPIIDPNNRKETNTRSIDWNFIAWAITTNPVMKMVTNKEVPGINLVGIPIK